MSPKNDAVQGTDSSHLPGKKLSAVDDNEIPEATNSRPVDGDSTFLADQEQPNSTSTGSVKCSVCESTFRRPEHLKRHFRSHTKEKPFECAQCGRHFSRTDTLHRHELSHHTFGADGKENAHRITVKTFRACFNCATARVRCSGGTPCGRCNNRSLGCEYPTARRSKAKARKEASQKLAAKEKESHLQRSNPGNGSDAPFAQDGESPPQPPAYQMTQFQLQINNRNTSSERPQNSADLNLRKFASERSRTRIGQQDTNREVGSHLPKAKEPANLTQLELSPYAEIPAQQSYPNVPTPGVQGTLPESEPGSGQHGDSQPGADDSNVDIEMTTENQQVHMGFDQSFLDPSILSMNWLPSDLFSDTTNNPPSLAGPSLQPNFNQQEFLDGPLPPMPWAPPIISADHISPSIPENTSQTPSGSISLGTDVESPGQYSQAVSSYAESHDTARSGDYYVDGAGARLPKYRRRQRLPSRSSAGSADISAQLRNDLNPASGFPVIQEAEISTASEKIYELEPPTYDKIRFTFLQLCCTENFVYQKFESETFPSAATLTNFIHAYLDSFQPVYPIFHPPTFNPNRCHWLVALAVSAIGCHFADIPEIEQFTVTFHEFLRRAINVEKEKVSSDRTPLWLLQAMLLNCVGLVYSGNERARLSGFSNFADLINRSNQERLLCRVSKSKILSSDTPLEQKWMKWTDDEVKRRTGYCIWLVDCTFGYNFDHRSLLTIDDGQAPLPSHESLWGASSAESWKRLLDKPQGHMDVSLYDAVHIIYIEKKLVPGIGEYGHMLLIHALYHRMWEVGDYFRRPLSFWNPTAKKQPRETAIPSGSVWLPGIPSYSKWRNSACDCLDILHWTANSSIARAAGLEHPTVLHLHASRLVLLTPFQKIRSLATSLALKKIRWTEHQRTIEWNYVWRWVKHDQYKARLAIIHAGTTLWHVRRYSTNAFHEPIAAFLAILTLWAYGYCHGQMMQKPRPHQTESRSDPSFIHLDRPCDDELVQLFVREGQNMKGNVTGVGDICAVSGPERVLRVGCETLAGLTSWGVSRKCIATLGGLAEVVSQHSMGSQSQNQDLIPMEL